MISGFINFNNFLSTFLLVCFLNLPFFISGVFIFLNRPLFNYDIIVALMVAVFSESLGVVVLILAWIIDALVSQSFIYYFSTPIEWLRSARFGAYVDWFKFTSYKHLFILIYFLIFLYFSREIYKRTTTSVGSLFAIFTVGLFLISIDIINGTSQIWRKDESLLPVNIAGSPSFLLFKNVLDTSEKSEIRHVANDQSILNKYDVFGWAVANPNRSILFVIVESFGVPKSDDTFELIRQPTRDSRYETRLYEIEFKGATTSGELRSLCGLEGSYSAVSSSTGNQCLPARLSRLGWRTIGFHGFSKKVFDRQLWWPSIGLRERFFIEDHDVASLSRCGSVFRGACDEDLLNLAVSRIAAPQSFAYVLTLNTHLPVSSGGRQAGLDDVCRRQAVSAEVCSHTAALRDVIHNIVDSASSLPILPLIVIVGDHAPPFAASISRNVFRQDVVPAFVLVPKS